MGRKRFSTLLTLLAIAGIVSLIPAPASAAKQKKTPEVYSATEDGSLPLAQALGGNEESSDNQGAVVEAVSPPPPPPRAHVTITTSNGSAVAPLPPQVAPPTLAEAPYDSVPDDQVNPVLVRIQLVEEIVRKYSRAYDDRAHTVRDLQMLLKQLDGQSARR